MLTVKNSLPQEAVYPTCRRRLYHLRRMNFPEQAPAALPRPPTDDKLGESFDYCAP